MQTEYLGAFKNCIIAFACLFFLHQIGYVNDLQANDVSINIVSVSIDMSDSVSIKYSLDGDDAGSVNRIDIVYEPIVGGGGEQEIFTKAPTENQTLTIPVSEFEFPTDSQSLNFVLWAFIDDDFQDASIIHSSIFLKNIESTAKDCDLAINLEWMNYASYPSNWGFPMPPLFDRVDVLVYDVDEEGQCVSPDLLGTYRTVMWDQDTVAKFNYGVGRYCFRLNARRDNISATSNTIITEIDDYNVPEIVLIRSVDVNLDNQTVEISAEVDDFGFNEFIYRLYRSDNPHDADSFVEIEKIDSHSNRYLHFVDKPDLQTNPWYYYIEADIIDCQGQGYDKVSETVPSIFFEYVFESVTQSDITIRFGWEYDVFFDNYDSFQVITDRGDNYDINDLTREELQVSIDIDQLGTSFYAWIQALQDETPVHSNEVHVRIHILDEDNIPNAIRPSSQIVENKKFLIPFVIPPDNYNIRIYNRNGMMVFDYDGDYVPERLAWDGTIKNKGTIAPEGAYIYYLEYITPGNNQLETHKGVVYLVW